MTVVLGEVMDAEGRPRAARTRGVAGEAQHEGRRIDELAEFVVEAFDEMARAGREDMGHEHVRTAVGKVWRNDWSTSHCSPVAS